MILSKQNYFTNFQQINCKTLFAARLKISEAHRNSMREEKSMQTTLNWNKSKASGVKETDQAFGEKIGLLGKLFGCWHKQISRPFTIGKDSYRACLYCGARKHFDTQNLKTFGSFHYPPSVSLKNF